MRPALVPQPRKITPNRLVVDEVVSFEGVSEDLLADGPGFPLRFLVEARTQPCCTIALHDERAHLGRIVVVMRIEAAELRFDEGLGQRLEALGCPVPHKFVVVVCERRFEVAFVGPADQRVYAVGGDYQVVSRELFDRPDDSSKPKVCADGPGTLGQLRDEIQSSDCGESYAIKHDAFATMDQRDVTPRLHPSRDGLGGFRIVGTKEIERLVGKDDTESPCGALGILLKMSTWSSGC